MILLGVIVFVYVVILIAFRHLEQRYRYMNFIPLMKFNQFLEALLKKSITIIVVINAMWVGLRTIGLLK